MPFKQLLEALALADVWRLLNPHSCEYTFAYSRIDYPLTSNSPIENVINA